MTPCASDQIREMEGLRQGGERFPLELAMSQISHQGQVRFIAVIRDIAERKRIEQMKNEFVSTVSHELRTPLTAIAGSLGLINGGALGAVPQAMAHMLSIAEANSQRLSTLINDLLDMEKLVAGKMHFDLQRRPLKPLLELALLHNQPYADQHQVRLELHAEHDVEVRVDTQRLAQVLANLLSNAAKFSPAGAVVQVSLETMADKLRVNVRDQGPGIPAAFHSHIFAKFSQADAGDTGRKAAPAWVWRSARKSSSACTGVSVSTRCLARARPSGSNCRASMKARHEAYARLTKLYHTADSSQRPGRPS